MLLEVLKNVASERLSKNDSNRQIQLSSVFMEYAVDEINKNVLPQGMQHKQDKNSNEFEYVMCNERWTIMNRAYRDDTNDEDVEREIYNRIVSCSLD